MVGIGQFINGEWYCDCDVDEDVRQKASLKTVHDESKPTFGKKYYRCPVANTPQDCKFFLWEEDARHRESVQRNQSQSQMTTTPNTPRHSFYQSVTSTPSRQQSQQQPKSGMFSSSTAQNTQAIDPDSDEEDNSSQRFQEARSNMTTPALRHHFSRDDTPTPSVTNTITDGLRGFDICSVQNEDISLEDALGGIPGTPSKSSRGLFAAQAQLTPSSIPRNTLLSSKESSRKRSRDGGDVGRDPDTPTKTRTPAGQRTIPEMFASPADVASQTTRLLEAMRKLVDDVKEEVRGVNRELRETKTELQATRNEMRETKEALKDTNKALRYLEESLGVSVNGVEEEGEGHSDE
ncbi:hypothetical protein QBC35DRAFT_469141 [Podospora australis]|uniref:GRF-type domain-containing protein n=1 Tax=Podospora australis TaxID=1536484 RepID=A0AAN7ANQ4_9PEZI|nr:hypothetical protein QBC35DRAFT_469141 [Podospora australis]